MADPVGELAGMLDRARNLDLIEPTGRVLAIRRLRWDVLRALEVAEARALAEVEAAPPRPRIGRLVRRFERR